MKQTALTAFLGVWLLGACEPADNAPAVQTGVSGELQVSGAWIRFSPASMAGMGAAYAVIEGGAEPDTLIGARTEVAPRTELHTTVHEGDVMQMRPVESFEVPARGELVLEPGGNHVMLFDAQDPPEAGSTVPLVLVFQNAGEVEVEAEVRAP
jgi:copper(I)-binding protein